MGKGRRCGTLSWVRGGVIGGSQGQGCDESGVLGGLQLGCIKLLGWRQPRGRGAARSQIIGVAGGDGLVWGDRGENTGVCRIGCQSLFKGSRAVGGCPSLVPEAAT